MCGIYGQVSLVPGKPIDAPACAMAQALYHRGPDEEGVWQNEMVLLGMRRLSIIDLAGGQQPIWNEDRTCCIVYNGELYNYMDLRPDLETRGHRFRTRSDTEVIVHAYEEWGPDCLKRFNGMFGFAIWDDREQTLFLARDRIGEKPLYYYQDEERLAFASEIKAILADPSIPRELNPCGLANYMAFSRAVAPDTMYRGIRKLLPAHYMLIHEGQTRMVEYWDIGDEPALPGGITLTETEYAERILSLLEDSVKRRMVADVPVGAFLSGGVDSSAIVALMKRHASGPIKTFSLGFSVGGAYNELSDAREVAQAIGTEHYELEVEHLDLVRTLRTLVYHYDEPFGDAAGFPVYLLSKFARQHVKVVLTGDGGDELFGGYRRYAADQVAAVYQHLPRIVTRRLVPAVVDRLPRMRRIKRSVHALPIQDPGRRYAAWLTTFTPEMQAELLQPQVHQMLDGHDPAWAHVRYYDRLNGTSAIDHLNRLMYVDFKTLMVDAYMEKTDKASMAASIEARLPLLDYRLAELAFQIPGALKIQGGSLKRTLKLAVRDLVPPAVLNRPKHGFAVPTDPWFRGDLRDYTFEVLLDDRARRRGYFDMAVVERLWKEHREGRHVWSSCLWLLLNFELWHQIYLDGEAI